MAMPTVSADAVGVLFPSGAACGWVVSFSKVWRSSPNDGRSHRSVINQFEREQTELPDEASDVAPAVVMKKGHSIRMAR